MTFTEILKDQVPSFSRSWLYVPRQAHSNSSVVIYKDGSDAHYIKQLKKWRLWAILVNRKWGDFPLVRCQICIAKCLYSYRDAIYRKIWAKINVNAHSPLPDSRSMIFRI